MDCGTATNPAQFKMKNDNDDHSLPGISPLVLCTATDADDSSNVEEDIVVEDVPSNNEDNEDVILAEVPVEGCGNTMRTRPNRHNANFLNDRYRYPDKE